MKGILFFKRWIAIWLLLFTGAVGATPPEPILNQGEKWRLAYYQGGEYYDYYQYLKVTIEGLMQLGWMVEQDVPGNLSSTAELWAWLSEQAESDFIEFSADGFYSANWDREYRPELRKQVIQRLKDSSDIDLLIAMGTWAGLDMVNDQHQVPTMVMSVTNARGAGLTETLKQKPLPHVYLTEDHQRYEQQVTLFHDLIRFKKLGVAYEDTLEGRSYASIEMIEQLARERGFEVITCHTLSDVADQELADNSVKSCFEQLASKVDAIYVTAQGGVNNKTIPQLVKIANRYGIPTFSQYGQREVKMGYLMSLSGVDQLHLEGYRLAADMARIFKGKSPRLLASEVELNQRIILNVATAEQIGLYLDADLLAAADQIYWQIEQP